MKPLELAQREVLAALPLLPVVQTPLAQALGLVTAEPITASHDVPPFANSAMDGYAVVAADVAAPPVTLLVIEDVPAGSVATHSVTPGTAIKIMTGAPLPGGADAVVPVEETEPADDAVRILAGVPPGASVRAAGGDIRTGSVVMAAGVRLGPPHLGVLASVGVGAPVVRKRPVAAVMSTGDEILAVDAELRPGTIHDSNRPMLRALLDELGAEVIDLGIIGDDGPALRSVLQEAAGAADVILTSGGVSMGEYDLVKAILAELGSVEFWKVAMQPAKPFAFGTIAGTPLFGLPGNPVSSMVAFEQFVRPGLLSMMGATALFRPRVTGVMGEATSTSPEKTVFVRVTTEMRDGVRHVHLAGGQSSNVLSALAASDAFAVIPVGVADVGVGDSIELEMFRWPETPTSEEAIG